METTHAAATRRVLDVPRAREIVAGDASLSYRDRFIADRLLDLTNKFGGAAEAPTDVIAQKIKGPRRLVQLAIAELAKHGLLTFRKGGDVQWLETGPLAEAWKEPAISAAPRISDVTNPLRYENAALQYVQAEFSAEIRAVEQAREEYSRSHPKVPPSLHAIPFDVAPKVAELVVRIQVNHGVDLDTAAKRFIGAWAQIEGRLHWKTGCGFNREEGWDLKYIGHDLGKIHAKLWRAQPSRPIVEAPPADAPAMSRDEIAEQSSEFLRAVGVP